MDVNALRPSGLVHHLNFFRVHVLLFVSLPLLFSLIFYWLNDARNDNEAFVPFIDSMMLCYSAASIAGLFPVVLSNLEVGQQIILALLSALGSYSFVSIILVAVRWYYFTQAMDPTMRDRIANLRASSSAIKAGEAGFLDSRQPRRPSGPLVSHNSSQRRIDGRLLQRPPDVNSTGTEDGWRQPSRPDSMHARSRPSHSRMASNSEAYSNPEIIEANATHTSVDMATRTTRPIPPQSANGRPPVDKRQKINMIITDMDRGGYHIFSKGLWVLCELVFSLISRFSSSRSSKLLSKFTIPQVQYLQSTRSVAPDAVGEHLPVKVVPYLTFDAIVGKNSAFLNASDEEREELRYMEYRALDMLVWIIPTCWVGIQVVGFAILAPYMARAEFRPALDSEGQLASVNPTWFALFQVISSYGNCGILVDASLVPFQKAYLLLWVMVVLIVAGNTGFPCFLRLFMSALPIIISYSVSQDSESYATLRFLLDHPRRCFLYMFPSTQTWYLLAALVGLNLVDFVLFLLLDIGNAPISDIPAGVRVMASFFQAIAVRCAGFHIVNLANLAPAVQILYIMIIYLSSLPISLTVSSTNVYEDRSIALNEQASDDDDEENLVYWHPGKSKTQIWGEYLTWHLRKQLSFDTWFLVTTTAIICVFERGKIVDPNKSSYFNPFSVVFEVVSAYATLGVSLGVPNSNICLSGLFTVPSKLLLCVIMLRGRHSGLPVAIDRAVLLPKELVRQGDMEVAFRQREDVVRNALHAARRRQEGQEKTEQGDVEMV